MNAHIEPGAAVSGDSTTAKLFAELATSNTNMAGSVLRFMLAFEQFPVPKGDRIAEADFELAQRLMQEEIKEMSVGFDKLRTAQTFENMTEFADGAIDSIYVILWSLLKFNLPANKLFNEVQRSNMAKLNEDGSYTKTEHGKVVKPPTWTPPDLQSIIADHFDRAVWNGNMRSHENE